MKIAFYSLALLLLFSATDGYSQSPPIVTQLKLPQLAPSSPDAAAIERFGNFQVNYSTGVPGISIPIWTIKCGSLTWPISLSYHASGIKVDQSASMVGLGWNLDGPGVITRTINGLPDEETMLGEPADFGSVTDNDFAYLYQVNDGLADAELDLFNYSFNGRSGKFVIPHNDAVNVLQVPRTNLKITHDAALNVFTIKDELGIVYTFDEQEETSIIGPNPTVTNTTSWYLTKVELPDKISTIKFAFEGAGPASETYYTFTQVFGNKYVPSTIQNPPGPPTLQPISPTLSSNTSGVTNSVKKLIGITFPNGSIDFNYDPNPRADLGGGNNVTNKLTSIVINEITNSLDTLVAPVKSFLFGQSYFYYKPGSWASEVSSRRLRLDNLVETGKLTGPDIKKYTFGYNTAVNMWPRGGFGQDMWGFNNGVTTNASLMQSENVSFFDGTVNVTGAAGNADRSVNATQMEAWMLTSITYPTGGKTEFDYEPHKYATDFTLSTPQSTTAAINGSQTSDLEDIQLFTYPSSNVVPGTTRLALSMSRIDYQGVTNPSVVVLRDVTLSQDIFVLSQPRPTENYSYDQPINLIGGHQYQLKATLYTNQAQVNLLASINVSWSESTTVPDIRTGGGLRIKEMLHYSNATTVAGKETFVYDTAVTLTPFHLINQRYKNVNYRLGVASGLGCAFWYSPVCRVYNSQSVYAISNALGSPMLYRRVEKITVDPATSSPNGKSVFVYDVFQDPTIPVGGPLALGAQWANGFLTSETHYKYTGGSYSMIQKKENEYNSYNSGSTLSLRVEPKLVVEYCFTQHAASTVFEELRRYTVHIPTGSKRLAKQTVTDVDEFQSNLVTTTINYYNNLDYDYPTKVATVDSKNIWDSVTYKRSPDFAQATNVYDKMEQQNILAPVIEQVAYNGTAKLSTLKNNYRDWFSNGKVIALDTVQASLYTNPLETRLRYYLYDAQGNPISVGKNNDLIMTYLYAYNGKLPIAEVTSASSGHVAYTSFETDEKGGWSGTFGAGSILNGSITGKLAWTQNSFSFSKTGLSTTLAYVVSYWSKNGSYSVNSTTAVTGRVVNGWTHYSHKVVNPAGGTITVSGSGSIDELRLYPAVNASAAINVEMTTYTYQPQVGVTSKCDANNRITYFEYDEWQRLILIRDQDRNVIKKFAYNYHGKPEYPNIYYNTAQPVTRYKQGCTGCQIGSLVTYTVPAGTYLSTVSVAAADALAQDDYTVNAQAYANLVGTCGAPGSSVMNGNNQITNNAFSVKFHNNCTGTDYTRTLNPNTNAAISPAIPVGNYTVTITKMFGPGSYTFKVNGQLLFTSSDPVFSNVTVLASGNQGVIIQL